METRPGFCWSDMLNLYKYIRMMSTNQTNNYQTFETLRQEDDPGHHPDSFSESGLFLFR